MTSLWVLVAILFTQLAVAAYVCPDLAGESRMIAASPAAMDKSCMQKDRDNPNLCLQYAQAGDQSLDRGSVVYFAPLLVILYLVFAGPYVRGLSLAPRSAVPDWLKRAISPPLSIRNCCFRI